MPSLVREVHVENLLSGRRMLIEWVLNPSNESVTAYEIWRSTTEYQGYEKIAEVANPTYQFIDKVPYTFGIVFFYKVIARDNSGLRSDLSLSNPVQDSTFDDFEERPFRAFDVSFDSFVVGEIPSGLKNSVNRAFVASSYFRFGTVQVFVNGVALVRGVGFTENTDQKTINLVAAPSPSTSLTVSYLKV